MTLVINLVTRNRPERMAETVRRTLPNIQRDDTVFMVSLDEDDEPSIEAALALPVKLDIRMREDSVGAKHNRALDIPAMAYLPMVDYCPHVTPGFDRLMIEAVERFPDGIGVAYGHSANASFPNAQCVTRGLADRLGFIYPPYFPYWFIDHWIDDVARLIDRISCADVQIEILKKDGGTQELREPHFWSAFYDCARLIRRRSARAIIDSDDFAEAPWRREILRRNHPLVEFRSQWINDSVREMARDMPEAAGDGGDRYKRLKHQAVHMMAGWWPDMQTELAAA